MQEMLSASRTGSIVPASPRRTTFDWARGDLRQGPPILAAFPKEIWQALPPVCPRKRRGEPRRGPICHQRLYLEPEDGQVLSISSTRGTKLPEFDLKTEVRPAPGSPHRASMSPKVKSKAKAEKEKKRQNIPSSGAAAKRTCTSRDQPGKRRLPRRTRTPSARGSRTEIRPDRLEDFAGESNFRIFPEEYRVRSSNPKPTSDHSRIPPVKVTASVPGPTIVLAFVPIALAIHFASGVVATGGMARSTPTRIHMRSPTHAARRARLPYL